MNHCEHIAAIHDVEPTPQECLSEAAVLPAAPDDVMGDLDKTGIRHVIKEHAAGFRGCYETYLQRGSEAGQVLAIFTVRRGQVVRAEVRGFDDELDRCVCRIVAGLVFPKFDAVINYPFTFRPEG